MQKISVRKMRRLNKSRVSQEHIHYGNSRQYVSDRKHPIYLETRAAHDLKFEVKKYRTDQLDEKLTQIMAFMEM